MLRNLMANIHNMPREEVFYDSPPPTHWLEWLLLIGITALSVYLFWRFVINKVF